MTTPTATHAAAAPIETRVQTHGLRHLRLLGVELRKVADTRAGLTVLAVAALLTCAFAVGRAWSDADFGQIASMAAMPGAIAVQILAILLVTQERTHQTGVTTWSLTPRRHQVIIAKAEAALVLCVIAWVLALALAAVSVPLSGTFADEPASWTTDWSLVLTTLGNNAGFALTGIALGLAFGSAPAPIIIVAMWSMVETMVTTFVSATEEFFTWINPAILQPIAGEVTTGGIARMLTAIAFWIVLPAIIGWRRTVTEEP